MMVKEKTKAECSEVSKSQAIRLVDVLVIAPFLGYVAYKSKGLSKAETIALYGLAGATLFYNLRNYIETKRSN